MTRTDAEIDPETLARELSISEQKVRDLRGDLAAAESACDSAEGERDALSKDLADLLVGSHDAEDRAEALARDPRLTLRWLVHDRTQLTAPPVAAFATDDAALAWATAYDLAQHTEGCARYGGCLDDEPEARAVVTLAPEVPT